MSADTIVLYKGDDPVGTGTARELAILIGVKERTINFLATPTAKRLAEKGNGTRLTAVRVRAEELA